MDSKIDLALDRIERWRQVWPNAAVLWSGGKDSTAMLHLLKFKAGLDLPVVQYREPKFRERYVYSDKLIKDWQLEVYDYPPFRVAIADGPDTSTGKIRFDMLKYQQWGETSIILSLGTEPPEEGKPYLCGVSDFLQRPTGTFNWPWTSVFIGTKYCDTDPIKGHVPLAVDVRPTNGGPVSLYPLRDWSDLDVFEYLEDNGIEPDPTRYIQENGIWISNPDKSQNADYYPVCFNCVNRHAGEYVDCPKLKATVPNMSHLAPYEDVVFKDLGFRPVWPQDLAVEDSVQESTGSLSSRQDK